MQPHPAWAFVVIYVGKLIRDKMREGKSQLKDLDKQHHPPSSPDQPDKAPSLP